MDKNTIIGFVLIGAIMVGFSLYNQPSQEELAHRATQDSIAQVKVMAEAQKIVEQQLSSTNQNTQVKDSVELNRADQFGAFSKSIHGIDTVYTLQNNFVELQFATKGGELISARLKNYQTHDSLPLYLFDKEEAKMDFTLRTSNSRVVSTSDLFFTPISLTDSSLTLGAYAEGGGILAFTYTLKPNSYQLGFDIKALNLKGILAPNVNYLEMNWSQKLRQQEKGRQFEERYTGLYYRFSGDDVENLSESSNDDKKLTGSLKWIGYKDQFFSTALIAKDNFSSVSVNSTVIKNTTSKFLKEFKTNASVDFDPRGETITSLSYYLGPNHYSTLRAIDKDVADEDKLKLDRLVPLGPSFLRWINQYITIPVFNFFGNYINNFGIIILLLTIVIKLIIFPMTYKSFMSQAKMRVLKPQINEINAKHPGQDKALERQKATMELYSRVGVSPMSGCIPMLLQMPILFAVFMFFPSAIELRQESFLWAKDLSTYDAIVSWQTHIPLVSTYFGNHISLFCLLMSITNILSTKFTMEQTAGQESMPGMKAMQYMMPVMFLVFFNNYASGLSFYYFVSTLLTLAQTFAFRYFVNEEKLLAKLQAHSKKPKKKSAFMQRLEQAQKEQERMRREESKKRGMK